MSLLFYCMREEFILNLFSINMLFLKKTYTDSFPMKFSPCSYFIPFRPCQFHLCYLRQKSPKTLQY